MPHDRNYFEPINPLSAFIGADYEPLDDVNNMIPALIGRSLM